MVNPLQSQHSSSPSQSSFSPALAGILLVAVVALLGLAAMMYYAVGTTPSNAWKMMQ